MNTKKEQFINKNHKLYKIQNSFKCRKCKIKYNNPLALYNHSYIHMDPLYCYFPKCDKIFSPKHTYQYKQHIDSHNGGLNIKCKFCYHISKSLSSNTIHMKLQHKTEYNTYMSKINEYNEDIKTLDSIHITNLTNKYINIVQEKDLEKSKKKYSERHNLDIFSDIAISYLQNK